MNLSPGAEVHWTKAGNAVSRIPAVDDTPTKPPKPSWRSRAREWFFRTREWFSTGCHSFFGHPFYQASLTLLLIVTGGVGSIYSRNIRGAFPFYWNFFDSWESWLGSWTSWSGAATVFWALAVISSLLFYFRNRTVEYTRIQDQNALQDSVRHAPKKEFLARFTIENRHASGLAEEVLGDPAKADDPTEMDSTIREIVRAIVNFARDLDGDYSHGRYAANVMSYLPASHYSDKEEYKQSIRDRLDFCYQQLDPDQLHGVLEIHPGMSAIAGAPAGEHDAELENFVLPILAKRLTEEQMFRVGPGAPEAFVMRETAVYPNIASVLEWTRTRYDVGEEVRKRFSDYFNGQPLIQSFVSLPIRSFSFPDRELLGILNIHSDREGLLTDSSGAKIDYCQPLLESLMLPLAKVLEKRLAKLPTSVLVSQDAVKDLQAGENTV